MFTERPNQEELRQGDIIEGVYYPTLNCENLRLIGEPNHQTLSDERPDLIAETIKKQGVTLFTAQVQVFRGFGIIISQCCDLALRSGKLEVPAFVISPLVEISYNLQNNSEKLSKFQENSLHSFVNLFYIPQQEPLPKSYMVDFNRMVSLPRTEFNFVLSKKVLQMTDEDRVKFKIKLSHQFGRATQEEIAAGLFPSL